MSPTPTGVLQRTDAGYDLVITRTFRAPVDDVWASVTEPERTARWFGTWRGDGAPGKTVQVQMAFEGDEPPWIDVRIQACDPPTRLSLAMSDEAGDWDLELLLAETDGTTELRFVQHLKSADGVGSVGPGWEFYLDMLVASRDGSPQPEFNDYYPAQQEYFEKQAG